MEDIDLLREYADRASEPAFGELVNRATIIVPPGGVLQFQEPANRVPQRFSGAVYPPRQF
jgi:hypothetical protein